MNHYSTCPWKHTPYYYGPVSQAVDTIRRNAPSIAVSLIWLSILLIEPLVEVVS